MKPTHKHHIIPRHAGGTDDPDNIVELTVEEHAEAHRILFEQHGRWQDKLAWLSLSNLIDAAEYFQSDEWKQIVSKRKKGQTPWNKGLTKENDPRVLNYASTLKQLSKEGKLNCVGDVVRGKKFSEEHRKILSERKLNQERKICPYCNRAFGAAMFARWHGDNCKSKK